MDFAYNDPGTAMATVLASKKLGFAYVSERPVRGESGVRYDIVFYRSRHGRFKEMSYSQVINRLYWRSDFVACKIERKDNQWKIIENFCYDETDVFVR